MVMLRFLLYLFLYNLCFTVFRHVCSKVKSVFGIHKYLFQFFRYLVCSIEWWFSEWFYKYIYEESLNDGKREISYNIKLDNLELVLSNYILFRCFIHRKGFSVVLICNSCSVNVRCFMFGNVNVNSCLHIFPFNLAIGLKYC